MTSKTAVTSLDDGVLHNDEWVRRWQDGDGLDFHQARHDPFLDENEERMFEGKKKSVFAPLCGKSLDLTWMYERGHTVVGAEIAEEAVRQLYGENKIDHDVVDIDNVGKLYKSKDGRLQVYVADLFDITAERCGQFDIIWDSKSVVAINTEDHNKYVALLLSLMKKEGMYCVWTIEYDHPTFLGPPHSFPDKLTRGLYGTACTIELIQEKDRTNKTPMSEEQLAKMDDDGRALMTSTSLFFRWYCLKLK